MIRFLIILCLSVINLCAKSPNVVVFLTDDQGWGDLSLHGNKNLSTPNLDKLAKEGAQFENFYVCQVCAPTRAEFLTGRYHLRTGVSGVTQGHGRLNSDEVTMADVFKSAGYVTGCFGKWHNGTQSPYHPNDRGFDEYYGFTSGHWGHYFSPPLDHNGKRVKGEGFIVDDFTNKAIRFIENNKNNPFFCYIPYNTPHSPMYVKDEDYRKFENAKFEMKHRDPKKEDDMMTKAALALCENIDNNVGRVLNKIESLGLKENTIILFFSDNGPNSFRWNAGMKGKKGNIDEGGLRSPLFIKWPGKIKAGTYINEITGAIDLLPSLIKMSGLKNIIKKDIDGKDISPLLIGGESDSLSRELYSIRRGKVSVRSQNFRLGENGRLYDIRVDRGQSTDVSHKFPEIKTYLTQKAIKFKQEMQLYEKNNEHRPYSVGYSDVTTLTARDGIASGTILRSSKSANNSFFKNWTSSDDTITWDVDVKRNGIYEAIIYYTCRKNDLGSKIRLRQNGGAETQVLVTQAFNPPLYDKSKERMSKSHYFMKDFAKLSLGNLKLKAGESTLTLDAPEIPGDYAIDIISMDLILK